MQKTLLIIGAGLMQAPAIKEAKSMGLQIAVTDLSPDAIGMKIADFPLVVSTRDIDGTLRTIRTFHENHPIDGVMTVGTDASRTVAAVANALGLPGIRYEVAERATNKLKMRNRFQECSVPIPRYQSVWSLEEAKSVVESFPLPAVVKPADNMGARGVKRIDTKNDVIAAFYEAKSASVSGEILIEEYIEGRELSVDALVYNDTIHIMGVADRIIEHKPYFVEMGHIMPTSLAGDELQEVVALMKSGIRALGITHGAAKGDIRLAKDGAKIIELAARLSGGFMSAYTFPLSTGVSVIRGAIEIALGTAPSETEYTYKRTCMEGALMAPCGLVNGIRGLDKALKIKGVKELFINHEPGSYVHPPTDNLGKSGNVIITAENREEARERYRQVSETVRFEVGEPPQLTLQQIENEARKKMYPACKVCSVCDGYECAGKMPGMGGVGTASSFKANLGALAKYRLNVRLIHEVKQPVLSASFLQTPLSFPVLCAPMTGTTTNMGGRVSEEEFAEAVVQGCHLAGTIAMVGDGATPDKYKTGLKAIANCSAGGIAIFKPREFNDDIIKRIHAAEDAGAVAVGVDIDSAALLTMALRNQPVGPKSFKDIEQLRKSTNLPFILKGIMNLDDALSAIDAGVDGIVVSNHGGRVLDYMPGAAEVLPSIVELCKGKVSIMVDGGIRTGGDVLKCLAIGADVVAVGRPLAIAAIGGGVYGVKYYLDALKEDLTKAMILTGNPSIASVTRKSILS